MKRAFWLFLLINILTFAFSQSNSYNNGNGTIIEIRTEGNTKWIIRRHIQSVEIGDSASNKNLNIYDQPNLNANMVGRLHLSNKINITQVAEQIIGDDYFIWLKINTNNNINGWIFFEKSEFPEVSDPYYNDRWEVLGTINIANKNWTRRRVIHQIVAYWGYDNLNIRNNPGTIGTKVISKITPPGDLSSQINLDVLEVTEETETIEGKTDRWLKIIYNGVEGWIFGGYTSVERGGPKYFTPEYIIAFELGWY